MTPVNILLIVRPEGTNSELYIEGQRIPNLVSITLGRIAVHTNVTMTLEFTDASLEVRGKVMMPNENENETGNEDERDTRGALDRLLARVGLIRQKS